MILFGISLALIVLVSTVMYVYLHYKTHMNWRFLYLDNLYVIALVALLYVAFNRQIGEWGIVAQCAWTVFCCALIPALGYAIMQIRFWRTPNRKINAKKGEMISPADGNVIYIKHVKGEVPISIKNGVVARLDELTKTPLLKTPCWLVGINMTPWDVHKNCAPIDGKIILNQHTKGDFLSLKKIEALTRNERNTYVIENDELMVGVVQTASKGVRRIDSYVKQGERVNQGDWLGMIRFGSQVDLIIPDNYEVLVELGQQIYAKSTIIARKE